MALINTGDTTVKYNVGVLAAAFDNLYKRLK